MKRLKISLLLTAVASGTVGTYYTYGHNLGTAGLTLCGLSLLAFTVMHRLWPES